MRGLSRVETPGIADCLAQPTAWLSDPLITVVTALLPSPGVAGQSLTLTQRSEVSSGAQGCSRLAQGHH